MSGETGQVTSGWTTDTLKAYFEKQLADLERMLQERYETQTKAVDAAFLAQETAMQAALMSAEKAVTKAETANEKRFEAANEWRAQSADRERSQQEEMAVLTSTFMPREVADAQFAEMRRAITDLTEKLSKVIS